MNNEKLIRGSIAKYLYNRLKEEGFLEYKIIFSMYSMRNSAHSFIERSIILGMAEEDNNNQRLVYKGGEYGIKNDSNKEQLQA